MGENFPEDYNSTRKGENYEAELAENRIPEAIANRMKALIDRAAKNGLYANEVAASKEALDKLEAFLDKNELKLIEGQDKARQQVLSELHTLLMRKGR